MKIAIIGSHGCGKTALAYSLCTELQKMGKRVELVAEMARRSPFPINEATSQEGQLWILHQHIVTELEASTRSDVVVCDRSVLDNYAYFCHKFGQKDYLDALIREWVPTYDLLVKVPIVEEWLINDGVRSIDLDFQRHIDEGVERLVNLFVSDPFRVLRLSYPFHVDHILTDKVFEGPGKQSG